MFENSLNTINGLLSFVVSSSLAAVSHPYPSEPSGTRILTGVVSSSRSSPARVRLALLPSSCSMCCCWLLLGPCATTTTTTQHGTRPDPHYCTRKRRASRCPSVIEPDQLEDVDLDQQLGLSLSVHIPSPSGTKLLTISMGYNT